MPRLFIGTFISRTEQQKLSVLPRQNEHLETFWRRKPRWVKPEKLHLTWLFLGDVDENLVGKVGSTLHKVLYERGVTQDDTEKKDLLIEFTKPEVWPSSRKPRMIVLTNQAKAPDLHALARTIRTGLIPFYTEETEQEHNQEFRPHITILRLDRRVENPPEKIAFQQKVDPRVEPSAINSLAEVLPVRLRVTEVCLIESHLGGHDYKVLETVRIPGPASFSFTDRSLLD